MPPLENSDVLQLVFSHLPPSYLFLGSVCRLWRDTLLESKHTKKTSWRTALHSQQSLEFACSRGELFDPRRWHGRMRYEQHEQCRIIGREVGKCGSKEMIRWALHRASSIHEDVCAGAASSGRVDVLEWLFARRDCHCWRSCGVEECMLELASKANTLAVFKCVWKWVWRHHLKFTNSVDRTYSNSGGERNHFLIRYAGAAVQTGLLEALKWVLDKGISHTSKRPYNRWIESAAGAGHIPMLQCIMQQREFPKECYHDGAVFEALTNHHVAAVEWLLSNGFTMDKDDMLEFAMADSDSVTFYTDKPDLPMLQLLRARGIGGADGVWTDDTYKTVMMHAGLHDDLDVLQWARQYAPAVWPDQLWKPSHFYLSYPWYSSWSLRCLQWAITQGCPWGVRPESVCRIATDDRNTYVNEDMVAAAQQLRRTWAHANGCPCSCAR
jgi:hypothetical protein